MKTAFLTSASIGALILASGAQAADLSHPPVYKAPPARSPAWSWTGFYVGGALGGVVSRDSVSNDPATTVPWLATPINVNGAGVVGGLEAGYNWQISQVVFGIESDISWSSLRKSATEAPLGDAVLSSSLNTLGTVRGRLGWAFDRTLLYGTGGVAFADLKDQLTESTGVPFTAVTGSSLTGWTAGGGVEYALTDHWTAKAEYLHVGFAQRSVTVIPIGLAYIFDYKDRLDIGRVGINYKF